ncbi:hypothetical protein [Flavobacterium caeni]|uniref:Uncharacterized protein n=1 Tax=Flavobacterium caeni TaxID=490189 RepID=A0A1G5E1H5_9FLAO|nr:hypothetical protein [Flavobacterium caeni]SCY20737.1 hypothetical protein SAMN02927903_00906 [Flavobacterium caeni]
MTIRILGLFLACAVFFSCQDEEAQRRAALRDAQKKEQIFSIINKGWNFTTTGLQPKAQERVTHWAELRLFLNELNQKPKSSMGEFRKKARMLSTKAKELNNNIPIQFNKPEVKARIAVLTTKINSINLFLHLQDIPDQKVIANIAEANEELRGLFLQMNEIVRKSEIPKEQGESDMIRMLDTTRAIPNTPVPPKPTSGSPVRSLPNPTAR